MPVGATVCVCVCVGGGGGGLNVRRKVLFNLLVQNTCLDSNQTWQESSLGVFRDSKFFKWYTWHPLGPRERAPKGQNCKFQI